MNKIFLSIIGISATVIACMGIALYVQSERIKAAKAELKLVSEEADELERSCAFLEAQNKKNTEALNTFVSKTDIAVLQANERVETIAHEKDSEEWCADQLPESIRLLFCDVKSNQN